MPATTITVRPGLVSDLPVPAVEGTIAGVTNAVTNVWGAIIDPASALVGSFHVLVYYDGTNWTVIGK